MTLTRSAGSLGTETAPIRRARPGLLRLLLGRKASAAGFTICLMMVLLAVAASAIAPYDPIKIAPATIL